MNFTQINDPVADITSHSTDLLAPSGLNGMLTAGLPSTGTICAIGTAAAAGYVLWEQLKFRWYRQGKSKMLPGPDFVSPLLGGVVDMVRDPYTFWEKQRLFAPLGMSWNSLVGTFSIFITDAALCRHVFSHNSPDTLLMALHPSARNVLGEKNIAFLSGPEHKALRRSFLSLFTRRALAVYVSKQDEIVRGYLKEWVAASANGPIDYRQLVRTMNQVTSQNVFAGPYLDDEAEREKFGHAYTAMTDAFLAFPLCVPGTAVWKGRQGRLYIIEVLTRAAARSKARMKAGEEPDCLMDFWSQQVLSDVKDAEEKGAPPPFYSSDAKMADSVMDFLFASQDASTSSLTWVLALMAEHPGVLKKVQEEQARLRPDPTAPITGEVLAQMEYTRQVVREVLRFRPPAPMVPQVAQQPFKINDEYTAPKGAMVIPSVWAACRQGYSQPDNFDPDRFGPERGEGEKFAANFLVFGHGPHYCVGKDYAVNHLIVFLARVATDLQWTRVRSDVSDSIVYLPTLYPGDSVYTMKWARPELVC